MSQVIVVQISVDADEFEASRASANQFAESVKAAANKSLGSDYDIIVNIGTSDSISV